MLQFFVAACSVVAIVAAATGDGGVGNVGCLFTFGFHEIICLVAIACDFLAIANQKTHVGRLSSYRRSPSDCRGVSWSKSMSSQASGLQENEWISAMPTVLAGLFPVYRKKPPATSGHEVPTC